MKKTLFTISLLVVSLVSISYAETYTPELENAYSYAYSIGITTQWSIDSANMYGSLIRSHMAKMMVNYAKQVLGQEPNTALNCSFTDVGNQSSELRGYIIEACQMWLMGIGITAFSPDAVVTRAQFGTVLSRALYADMYNDGDPYYLFHLEALKEATIMNNISTPSASEIRGYVMLMMMRAGGGFSEDPTPVCSPENQVLCLVASPTCPVECQGIGDITSYAGTLNIASASLAPGTFSEGAKYAGSLKLTATESDIIIKSLSFQKIGTFTRGRIEDDGVKINTIQTLLTDLTILTLFTPGITIKQGESKTLSIFIEGSMSEDQGVVLLNKSDIQSSANGVSGGFPVRIVK